MKFIAKLMSGKSEVIAETELEAEDIGRALPPAIAWMVQNYEAKYGRVIVPEYGKKETLAEILRDSYASGTWATVEDDAKGNWELEAEGLKS